MNLYHFLLLLTQLVTIAPFLAALSPFQDELSTCRADLARCQTRLQEDGSASILLIDNQQRQLFETQKALEEASEHIDEMTQEMITYRLSATEERHKNYALILELQQLKDTLEVKTDDPR